tara:strand:- start:6 stop:746 length:741 start_codon:yes stop_codon:yes gene_type:complete
MGLFKTVKRRIATFQNLFSKKLQLNNKNIIITGANSGIALALAKNLNINNNILAFVNKDNSNIRDIEGRDIKIINWDFKNIDDHKDYINEIIKFKPNIIINSAATFGPENQKYYELDIKEFFNIFNVNVFSTLKIIESSVKAKEVEQIVNISSEMGSITLNKEGDYYYYRTSKTLLNSITKNLSIDLKQMNINVYCIHPGNVKTKLNVGGVILPTVASQKIINICAENNLNFSGKFIDINKNILEW